MKLPIRSLLLAFATLTLAGVSAPAQDATSKAAAVATEAAKKLDADTVQKVTEVASANSSATKKKVQGVTTSVTPNPDSPEAWGKNETHKLAVMEVQFGGVRETVMFELFPGDAPKTVANFVDNCDTGAYNGLAVHRAIDGYLVQTGDPLTSDDANRDRWGTGGEDKAVPAEIKRKHKLGAVAMARRSDRVNPDRKSNGYQFYFALGNMAALDGQYTIFGQVVSGLDVLERISRAPADSNDCPLERIEVKGIKVIDHKGPLIEMRNTGGGRRYTKPASAKSGLERFLERVW